MRILIVEDEARLARQLATALTEAGYAVDCAADGERADARSEQIEGPHGDPESGVHLAEDLLVGHCHVVEDERPDGMS